MRAVILQFLFESNTFNPETTGMESFVEGGTWLTEETAIREWAIRAPSQMTGSLEVLEKAGWATAPCLAAVCGSPSGRLSREAFTTITEAFRSAIDRKLPADGLILHLHGAACAIGEDDVEGSLLEMIREKMGFDGPLILSLDLHANVTRSMVDRSSAITAYRTMPHTDFVETGRRAARLLLCHRNNRKVVAARMAALIPPTDTHDSEGRFAWMLTQARRMEEMPGIEDVSLFPVQPWLDIDELGSCVVVTGTDPLLAESEALGLASAWYDQRNSWMTGLKDWGSIESSLLEKRRPGWVLVDTADATTGGSDGRSAEAVRRLMPLADRLPGKGLLWVVDPEVVRRAEAGDRTFVLGRPEVAVSADEVMLWGEVAYRARGGVLTGGTFGIGRTVVLSVGQLRIVVSSTAAFGADPAFYEAVNLDPENAQVVLAKSPMGWRAGYGAAADRGLLFDGPGQTSLDFRRLPFRRAGQHVFPMTASPRVPVATV